MSILFKAEAMAHTRTNPLGHELGTFHLSDMGDNDLYVAFCVRCRAVVYCSARSGTLYGAALTQRCDALYAKWGGALDEVNRGRR